MAAPLYFRHQSSIEHDTGDHPEGPDRIPAIEDAMEARGWLGYERREAPAGDAAGHASQSIPQRSRIEMMLPPRTSVKSAGVTLLRSTP